MQKDFDDLGFAQPEAANDTVYAETRLACQGQIRFGASGRAAAAALSGMLPGQPSAQTAAPPTKTLFREARLFDSVSGKVREALRSWSRATGSPPSISATLPHQPARPLSPAATVSSFPA